MVVSAGRMMNTLFAELTQVFAVSWVGGKLTSCIVSGAATGLGNERQFFFKLLMMIALIWFALL